MRKRLVSFISVISVIFVWMSPLPVQAQEAEDGPHNLYAQSAVLLDADSGRVLFGKEEDVKRPMASTTKIMTCILALENMKEEQVVSVSDYAARQPEVHLGVRAGEEYYIKDLLHSLMLESHNDSAVIIAEGIGGTVEGFASLMNEKAQELGCSDTHFVTPNGLDGKDKGGVHSTTAVDLARIMKYCIMDSPQREEFLKITRTKSYEFSDVSGKKNYFCSNHNAFLTMMEGALSGKTGFTADAGYCYVGALKRGKRTFIVALLACGWPNNKGYKWKDTRALMEYGINQYEYRNVWEETPEVSIPVKDGVSEENIYKMHGDVTAGSDGSRQEIMFLLRKDEQVEVKRKIRKSFHAPVKKGEKAGSVLYVLDGRVIAERDIVTLEDVEKRNIIWCSKIITRQFLP